MNELAFEHTAKLRSAIAKDQRLHYWRLFCEPVLTRRELERRERMWMWWGGIEWQARMAARGLPISKERSFAREGR